MIKNFVNVIRCLFAAVVLLGLSGCGDSNNSSVNLTPVGTVVNLSKFASSFMGLSNSVTLNFPDLQGTDPQGNALTGSASMTPDSNTTTLDDGTKCYSSVDASTLNENGSILVTESITKYFKVSDGSFYRMVAVSDRGTTTYVRTSADPFPHTIKVGDSGNMGVFQGSDGTTLFVEWAMNAGIDGGSIFVISEQFYDAGNGMTSEEHNWYLDAQGNPTKFAFHINLSDGTYQVSGDISG